MVSDAADAETLEEERRLVEDAQAGNLDALRPIFERYARPLFSGVIVPRLGNTAAAEDVLRDTFSTAVHKINRFTWQGRSIYAWLRQIAVNKVYDVHRKTQRTRKLTDALAAEATVEDAGIDGPDEMLIAAEEQRINRVRIATTLDQLSDRYRMAIQLRLIDELPREECARKMDVTIGNFDVLLFRAVRSFRKRFGDRD